MSTSNERDRCQALWFFDGTIILRCQTTLFRVYTGILSAQSHVFRDMLAIGTENDSVNAKMDGVPLVDLSDNVQDLTTFLRTLFDTCYYDNSIQDFRVIAAVLRLSTKYDVPRLRRRAIDQLLTAYPVTLEGFQRLKQFPESSRIKSFPGMEVFVVNLAEEVDVPHILPSAYYRLVHSPTWTLFDGVVHPDTPDAAREFLCARASWRCMIGREALRKRMTQVVYRTLYQPCPHRIDGCDSARVVNIRRIDEGLGEKSLGPFHCDWPGGIELIGLCAACHGFATRVLEVEQQAAWDVLPGWFELHEWEVIFLSE